METSTSQATQTPFGIDTLAASKRLTEAGIPKKQAEAQVQLWAEIVGQNLVTKPQLDTAVTEMKQSMSEFKVDILRWMTTGFLAQTALLVTLIKVL